MMGRGTCGRGDNGRVSATRCRHSSEYPIPLILDDSLQSDTATKTCTFSLTRDQTIRREKLIGRHDTSLEGNRTVGEDAAIS